MLFTAVAGNGKGGEKVEGEQEIKNDDPLQYTDLNLNQVVSNQLFPNGLEKATKVSFQQDITGNSSTTSSSYQVNNTDNNQVGKELRRQSVTLDTFKAFDHSILQPNTLRKNTLMQQRLEKALSEKASNGLNTDTLGLRRGSVPGEWGLGAGSHPDANDGTRMRRASMPGGTVIGSERKSMN